MLDNADQRMFRELTAGQKAAIRRAVGHIPSESDEQHRVILRQAQKYGVAISVIKAVMGTYAAGTKAVPNKVTRSSSSPRLRKMPTIDVFQPPTSAKPRRTQRRACPECGSFVGIQAGGLLVTHIDKRRQHRRPCPGGVPPPAKNQSKTTSQRKRVFDCLTKDCRGDCGLRHRPSRYAVQKPDPTGLSAANVRTSNTGLRRPVRGEIRVLRGGLPGLGRRSR